MTAYMVVADDDLNVGPIPAGVDGWAIQLVSARKTANWRGRRFNIRTVRAAGLVFAGGKSAQSGPYKYTRTYHPYVGE